ncbi:MAG: O-antigen ligase family protein [Methylococcales bacterium]|nr:O-antigen ligase family protein [Methylococcales bacterium]
MHPFWALTAEQLPNRVSAAISLSPAESINSLMKLLSYFLVFFLSFQFSRQSDKATITFNTLAYVGAAYALYGLIAFWGDYKALFWFEKTAYLGNVTSTFINRNSFATYAGLSLLCLFPLLFRRIESSLIYGVKNYFGLQYFIEHFIIKAWLPLLMLSIILTALFLSHSRGGFLSSLFAITVFLITSLLAGKLKKGKSLLMLVALLSIITFSFWNSSDKLIERMDNIQLTKETNGRIAVYAILNQAIAENPWLGTGYGSFEKSFRLYRNQSIRAYYTAAHNTYLENIFELGILPTLALCIAILLIAIRCLQGIWTRKRYWYYPAIGFSATLLVGVHSLVDFSLQIPAVAYTYATLLGAAFAQSLSRSQRLANY